MRFHTFSNGQRVNLDLVETIISNEDTAVLQTVSGKHILVPKSEVNPAINQYQKELPSVHDIRKLTDALLRLPHAFPSSVRMKF